jgi:hypothetical protein
MTLPNWIVKALTSAVAYIAGRYLYLYFAHHRAPVWSEIPSLLESWLFFAIVYWLLNTLLAQKQGRRSA